ncbi:MAG: UMP kinase, partial [Eubacterium sp.]|nr:UMP kinase [Eubacterium sp.]
ALLKATNVDGIFDKDPNKYADAVKYDDVTFQEVITKDLKVMDSTAFSLCKDNDMPIIVFNLNEPDNILRVVNGEKIGTTVKNQ